MSETPNTTLPLDLNSNVIIDTDVTTNAAKAYLTLTTEEIAVLNKLYETDGDMMNWWFGEAGEAFCDMCNIIETEFDNLTVFSDNTYGALDVTVFNFNQLDMDRSGSIVIQEEGK